MAGKAGCKGAGFMADQGGMMKSPKKAGGKTAKKGAKKAPKKSAKK